MKNYFPVINNNPDLLFLDSAATMQKPQCVIDDQKDFLENSYAVIGKGNSDFSKKTEEKLDFAKQEIANFFGTTKKNFCFTGSATESINIFVNGMKEFLQKGDKILIAAFEHNANFLPWADLEKELGVEIVFINPQKKSDSSDDLIFGLESLKEVFNQPGSEKIKVASIFHASNLTGDFFHEIEEIGDFLKSKKVEFFLDCAQSIGHKRIDLDNMNVSGAGFSAHKIGGPTGVGGLYLKDELIEKFKPLVFGGGISENTTGNDFKIISGIKKFEPGTPKVDQIIGFLSAIKFFEKNFESIQKNEENLTKYALEKFSDFKKIQILGSKNASDKAGIISFSLPGISVEKAGEFLGENGVLLRVGTHCNCIGHKFLCLPGSIRISFAPYNDKNDVDKFFEVLKKVYKI